MNRRQFLAASLSPALTLPLLSARRSPGRPQTAALYLLGDSPEEPLGLFLDDLPPAFTPMAFSFAFRGDYPQPERVRRTFLSRGWRPASPGARPAALITSTRLGRPCAPSFTLIAAGGVTDIRSKRLFDCWKDMSRGGNTSSLLTVVSLPGKAAAARPGRAVAIMIDGRRKDRLPLARDAVKTYEGRRGRVALAVTNGAARVLESSCPQKICACVPPVAAPGERIICAPNRFFLEVEGDAAVDTLVG